MSASLGEMLQSPLPVPGLTMNVAAPVFRDEKNMGKAYLIAKGDWKAAAQAESE